MVRGRWIVAAAAAGGVLLPGAPASGHGVPSVEVQAAGNAATGGLAFIPADATLRVGDEVGWTNTDFFAPHTVVERHGLWRIEGDYGATPLNPPGFAPGVRVERRFEAGTHRYLCTVHPQDMIGSVAVPVGVLAERRRVRRKPTRRDRRRTRTVSVVSARWAIADAAEGQAFDVERRAESGDWRPWLTATRVPSGEFRTAPRRVWELRARLRSTAAADRATDWSPVAVVRA